MRLTIRLALCASLAIVAIGVAPASAQYRGQSTAATGENYHIEFGVGWWEPSPSLSVSSESLGITGTDIDAVADLGMSKTSFEEFRLVFRPAKKHKLRVACIPIKYTAQATLERDIVFNGIKYHVNVPVDSSLDWKAWRFGYEYDFISRDSGFVGLLVEAKYTDVTVRLSSPTDSDFTHVRAPIPAAGGIFRVYPAANISITGEATAFKLPTDVDKEHRYDGKYIDADVYATLNFTNNFGVQGGYRYMNVSYRDKLDTGHFTLNGPYLMGVVRF